MSVATVRTHTEQQKAIIAWVPEGTGHAVVIARAGTGKTSTALDAVRLMAPSSDRNVSVTLAMFNHDIAVETRGKLAADGLRANATTFHAAGWSALLRAYPKIKLSGTGPKQAGVHKWDVIVEKLDIPKTYQSFAHKAMSMAKQRAFGLVCRMSDPTAWLKIADDFDLDTLISAEYLDSGLRPRDEIIKEGLQWAFKALKCSNEMLDTIADHDDQIYGPLVRDLKLWESDWLIIDEAQDTNPARRLLARKMVKRNGRTLWIGDPCQPLGTKVTIPGGETVNIEDLRVGDKVVSYDPGDCAFIMNGRNVNGITRRPYIGDLIVIRGPGHETRYTPTHICLANFTDLRNKFAVYAMRKGDQFRIGKCKMNYSQGSGVSARMHHEEADASWILSVHDTEEEAYFHEQAIAGRFGLPQLMFSAKKMMRGPAAKYLPRAWEFIGSNYDRGITCLRYFGRLPECPLFERKTERRQTAKRPILTRACNLMNGVKMLPFATEKDGRKANTAKMSDWLTVTVDSEWYEGDVISLDVGGSKLYVADNLVTHNCQSIYAFTGADGDAMDIIAKEWNAKIFYLTTTFRCPKVAVRMVQQLYVPDFEAGPANIEGDYWELSNTDFYQTVAKTLTPQTVFLCRNTAPLIKAAFRMLGMGIACSVEGKDIGADIVSLVNRWSRVKTLATLQERLKAHLEQQTVKLTQAGKDRQLESLNDRVETVFAVIEGLPKGATLEDLKAKVDELFQKTPKGETAPPRIRLMTIHRSKGLEAPTIVFLGRQELIPSRFAKREEQIAQEDNLAYVGLTRVQERLIEVRL